MKLYSAMKQHAQSNEFDTWYTEIQVLQVQQVNTFSMRRLVGYRIEGNGGVKSKEQGSVIVREMS